MPSIIVYGYAQGVGGWGIIITNTMNNYHHRAAASKMKWVGVRLTKDHFVSARAGSPLAGQETVMRTGARLTVMQVVTCPQPALDTVQKDSSCTFCYLYKTN